VTARGQANLVGFAVAILVVVTVTVAGVALANDALVDADRTPARTHAAERLAAHLVHGEAAHTRERNVLRAAAADNLTAADLNSAVPPVRGRPIRVAVGGNVVLDRGDPTRGEYARIERRVRVERDVPRSASVDLTEDRRLVLPDHAGQVAIRIETDRVPRVTTVRAGDRVVLHDPTGLDGRYTFRPPATQPLPVSFEVESGLRGRGTATATVSWTATNASVESLEVTVGD
jgi:hypothetical protein